MAPRFSSGIADGNTIAYQDDADPSQWHYIPGTANLVFGETLTDFEVVYWGINDKPYYADMGDGSFKSSSGGILAGRAKIDITAAQRASILAEITRVKGISAPSLMPLSLKNIKVKPVIASKVLGVNPEDVIFPETLQLGTTFSYNVSAKGTLFSNVVAASNIESQVVSRPSFSVNVEGEAEFVGDPWVASISCDLSQVWSYTRTQISASLSYGWITIGSLDYDKIAQNLIKNQIIKLETTEGSLDNEKYGRQILESVKVVFEKINTQAIGGEGFFRFEPNPSPQGTGGAGNGSPWWPWNLSINASYAENTFTQVTKFNQVVSYKGRFRMPMGCSMVLAVKCNPSSQHLFQDLQNINSPCLSQEKLDGFQRRVTKEQSLKTRKLAEYYAKVENDEWTPEKYMKMVAFLEKVTLTETTDFVSSSFRAPGGTTLELPAGFYTLSQQDVLQRLKEIENEA
jgi:hypothetical protein